ncbi:Uma2 family endonuclease, partial [Microcoleus sp. herbarium8]
MNSQVIIEVLSNSTKTYDRSDQFKFYQTIPTLQEYIRPVAKVKFTPLSPPSRGEKQ